MATPTLAREGARAGGLGTTTFAVACRTDSEGATLDVKIYVDPQRQTEASYSTDPATLDADNNFQGTVYVTGLTANTKYWWAVEATDATTNSILGTEAGFTAGSFKTFDTKDFNWKCHVRSCLSHIAMREFDTSCEKIVRDRQYRMARKPDFAFQIGDIYYSEAGPASIFDTTAYAEGVIYLPATDAAATMAAYRTNFMNTYSLLGYDPSAGAEAELPSRVKPHLNVVAEQACKIPHYYMWDDHDRAFNDCDDRAGAAGDLAIRWDNGRDSGHEMFMGLQKALVNDDTDSSGTPRSWTAKSSEDSYFVVDVAPVRFIVMDVRTYRVADNSTDNLAKTTLGTEQDLWVQARISDNPHRYLVIISPVMFDGNHGWNDDLKDCWRGYQTHRAEFFEYIWQNGDPQRTVLISGDTHEGAVLKYRGPNLDKVPIYEFMTGNTGWLSDNHGFINGLREDNGFTGSTDSTYFSANNGGVYGGELVHMALGALNGVEIEVNAGKLRVGLWNTQRHNIKNDVKIGPLYTRDYQ